MNEEEEKGTYGKKNEDEPKMTIEKEQKGRKEKR